jgi:hypothetical protein
MPSRVRRELVATEGAQCEVHHEQLLPTGIQPRPGQNRTGRSSGFLGCSAGYRRVSLRLRRCDEHPQGSGSGLSGAEAVGGRVSIMLRPIGAPTSIGLYGLGAASWTLAGLQLGWIPPEQGKSVALVLTGFAFVAQLFASVFAFSGATARWVRRWPCFP